MISVIFISDSTMVDEYGFLRDDDLMSRVSEDDLGEFDHVDPSQDLDDDLHISDSDTSNSESNDDEEEEQFGDIPGIVVESISPTQAPGRQGAPEVRPTGTPGAATVVSRKLLMTSCMCLLAPLRNVILLTSNLETLAGQWPRWCSGPQTLGPPRMRMHSWQSIFVWFLNKRRNWKRISSKRVFSRTSRRFLATRLVMSIRTKCSPL